MRILWSFRAINSQNAVDTRPGRSESALSALSALNQQPLDAREVGDRLENQLSRSPPSPPYPPAETTPPLSGSRWRRDHRPWVRWPVALFTTLIYEPASLIVDYSARICDRVPPVIPAVFLMLFLYVAIPLLIAWDVI